MFFTKRIITAISLLLLLLSCDKESQLIYTSPSPILPGNWEGYTSFVIHEDNRENRKYLSPLTSSFYISENRLIEYVIKGSDTIRIDSCHYTDLGGYLYTSNFVGSYKINSSIMIMTMVSNVNSNGSKIFIEHTLIKK